MLAILFLVVPVAAIMGYWSYFFGAYHVTAKTCTYQGTWESTVYGKDVYRGNVYIRDLRDGTFQITFEYLGVGTVKVYTDSDPWYQPLRLTKIKGDDCQQKFSYEIKYLLTDHGTITIT